MIEYVRKSNVLQMVKNGLPAEEASSALLYQSIEQMGAERVAPIAFDGDDTLMVTVEGGERISRVIVLYGDSIFCGVFYPDGEKDGEENDFISRQDAQNKLIKLVNEFEGILSDIRMREGNDCVCGLCEYDGAYIGESGDWCNECPGFEKDDCFMLKEKYRKEWTEVKK